MASCGWLFGWERYNDEARVTMNNNKICRENFCNDSIDDVY